MNCRKEARTVHAVVLIACMIAASRTVASTKTPAAPEMLRPNDPLFPKQEALFNCVNAGEAWKITKGDPNVLVGVVETGFDFFHPDLKANLVPGFFACGNYHTEFFENIAHGTVVVSLIAAVGNNGIGMTGLAPGCRVLAASLGMIEHKVTKLQKKFMQDHPEAGPSEWGKVMRSKENRAALMSFSRAWGQFVCRSTAESIRYLVDHQVRVINISGLLQRSLLPADSWQTLEDVFAYAREKGTIIVLGAGNNGVLCEDYPGDSDSVIVVGATRLDDTRWEEVLEIKGSKIKQGSNFGKRLTVMAPMENLQVCLPHDRRFYACEDGPMGPTKQDFQDMYEISAEGATSWSAPIVTALVALIRSVRPDLDAKAVIEIIRQGCDDLGDEGYDVYTGFGRVNFGKTLKIAMAQGR
ncbi:MAG: S8 family serine peptidase [Planctomycetes bacterium]|nr:S8 family serine peptidase [Planctomycetota bacterium]